MSFAEKIKNNNSLTPQKRASNSNFRDQLKGSEKHLVYLVRGTRKGTPAWHYVHVEKPKLPLFLKAVESPSINVRMYGKILHSGTGDNPPESIKNKIEEMYQ